MYHQIAHVPGGQPIGALERGFAKLATAITRRLPGRRREVAPR
jgi:lipopolysaccharide export system permease protein